MHNRSVVVEMTTMPSNYSQQQYGFVRWDSRNQQTQLDDFVAETCESQAIQTHRPKSADINFWSTILLKRYKSLGLWALDSLNSKIITAQLTMTKVNCFNFSEMNVDNVLDKAQWMF